MISNLEIGCKNIKYMDNSKVDYRVKSILVNKFGRILEDITSDTRFSQDLGFDSLDNVEMIMDVENEFDIVIPDEDAEKLDTVGELVSYLEGKII